MKKITTLLLFLLSIFNINAAHYYIDASNYSYTPSAPTINLGDTVTWINISGFHDVNGDINSQTGASFNNPVSFYLSPVTSPDTIGSYVFTVAGTYDYDCSIGNHAANGMVASINVLPYPSVFNFTPTSSSSTIYGQVQINGVQAEGDDWIAAFDENGNCAGASQLIINNGDAYISLVIYGDDATTSNIDEGMNSGEDFYLHLYDHSEDTILIYESSSNIVSFSGWVNTNGSPLPFPYNDPTQIYNFTFTTYDFILPNINFCTTDTSFTLSGGQPSGGIYSGPGVINGVLSPSSLPVGNYTISYTVDFQVMTQTINIFGPTSSTTNITNCDSYFWNNNLYNSSGTFNYLTTNSNGCDSTAVLNLTINETSYSYDTVTICDSIFWNNQWYSQNGDYSWIGVNELGCDSIANLQVNIINCCDAVNLQVDEIFCDEVYLSWDAPSATSFSLKYRILGSTTSWSGGDTNVTQINNIAADSLTLINIQENTSYEWRVRPFGCSPSTNWFDGPSFLTGTSPLVTLQPLSDLCENTPSFILNNGLPQGGNYFINGNLNSNFDPSQLGLGNQLITYTYTDSNGCESSDNLNILITQCEM